MSIILLALKENELNEELLSKIRGLAPDRELIVTQDRARIESLLDDIEITFGSFPKELISQAPRLRWCQEWGAGVDWLLRYPELADSDLIVTNASGVHAVPISEHIMAFLLAFARGFPEQFNNQLKSTWARPSDESKLFELEGKTMLLIGVGEIGARTAMLAAAHGIQVVGMRRNPDVAVEGVTKMVGPAELHDHLPEADFVVLTVPLTDETRCMIGETELCLMKNSSIIVNIGRGGTIHGEKLIEALNKGWIGGAGLDVVASEPLDKSSPLWTMSNVIITAHYSGLTPHYMDRALAIFLDNLERYTIGQDLRNVVDKRLAY